MDRRHDGDTEINWPLRLSVLHAEASVLRHAALGDIELAHYLDARNDSGVVLLRDRRHGLGQHAVNAELDADRIIAGLDMNIAGPPLQRSEDGGIHEPDDRAHVTLGGQLVNRNALVAAFLLVDDVQREALASVLKYALRLLRLLENFCDLSEGRNFSDDPLTQQQADLVDHHQLAGIGNGNGQPPVPRFFQRNKVVAEHKVRRDFCEQIVMELKIMQVHKLAAITPRYILRPLQFFGMGSGHCLPVSAIHEYRLFFYRASHSSLPKSSMNARSQS